MEKLKLQSSGIFWSSFSSWIRKEGLQNCVLPGSRSRSKTAQDLSGLSGARFERFERFERFSSKIWALWAVFERFLSGLPGWAVWEVFLEKPLKPLKFCLKIRYHFKNRSLFVVIFERFFKQDLSGFWAVFERSSRVEVPDSTFLFFAKLPTPPPPPPQRTQHPTNPPPPTYPPPNVRPPLNVPPNPRRNPLTFNHPPTKLPTTTCPLSLSS